LTLNTLVSLICAVYLYTTIKGMRTLLYPFEGVAVATGAPSIKPLWPEGTPLLLVAYLSTSPKPSPHKALNGTGMPNMPVIWEAGGTIDPALWGGAGDKMMYGMDTATPERHLELLAPDGLGSAARVTSEARLAEKKQRLEDSGGSLLLMAASLLFDEESSEDAQREASSKRLLQVDGKQVWSSVRRGKSLYLHVHVVVDSEDDSDNLEKGKSKDESRDDSVGQSQESAHKARRAKVLSCIGDRSKSLYGTVELVKFEPPSSDRLKRWLLQDFGWGHLSAQSPWPDEETKAKGAAFELKQKAATAAKIAAAQALLSGQTLPKAALVPKWKPEVAVRLVVDNGEYPSRIGEGFSVLTPASKGGEQRAEQAAQGALQALLTRTLRIQPSAASSSFQLMHAPVLHVDEIGLTSDKYLPLNDTVGALPLKLSFSPMAPARQRLMTHFQGALESQKELGFADSDIDDVRRLISDTSVYLLTVTLLASVLHLLFEFLAFKSDINFWQANKSLAGLSVRTLFIDLVSQLVILLYLADLDTSLLVTVPSGFGLVIQLWKCQRATGFALVRKKKQQEEGWLSSLFPFSVVATRLVKEQNKKSKSGSDDDKDKDKDEGKPPAAGREGETNEGAAAAAAAAATAKNDAALEKDQEWKAAESMRVDALAIKHLTLVLLPLVVGFSLRSLVAEQHFGWFSWLLSSLTGTVYTFGFILMTPQLFINYHLKSVSHLPWRFLCFRFVNTFIDDLFAFIIRMPTMHRVACFRDDAVFFVYLYQRWAYPVDSNRPMAAEDVGGGGGGG